MNKQSNFFLRVLKWALLFGLVVVLLSVFDAVVGSWYVRIRCAQIEKSSIMQAVNNARKDIKIYDYLCQEYKKRNQLKTPFSSGGPLSLETSEKELINEILKNKSLAIEDFSCKFPDNVTCPWYVLSNVDMAEREHLEENIPILLAVRGCELPVIELNIGDTNFWHTKCKGCCVVKKSWDVSFSPSLKEIKDAFLKSDNERHWVYKRIDVSNWHTTTNWPSTTKQNFDR